MARAGLCFRFDFERLFYHVEHPEHKMSQHARLEVSFFGLLARGPKALKDVFPVINCTMVKI
jgi:hypothetical protein